MAGTLPQGGVSEGAGPGIYNYRRVFGRSSRDTEQKPEDASMTEGIGGSRGKIGEGCARSRRKCNFWGPACPKPCRRRRLRGCQARNLQLSQAPLAGPPGIQSTSPRMHPWGVPGEGSGRSRRKCNFGGHGRNTAAGRRLRGCRARNLQLSQGLWLV